MKTEIVEWKERIKELQDKMQELRPAGELQIKTMYDELVTLIDTFKKTFPDYISPLDKKSPMVSNMKSTGRNRIDHTETKNRVIEILSINKNGALSFRQLKEKLPTLNPSSLDYVVYKHKKHNGYKIELIDHPENGRGFIKVKI